MRISDWSSDVCSSDLWLVCWCGRPRTIGAVAPASPVGGGRAVFRPLLLRLPAALNADLYARGCFKRRMPPRSIRSARSEIGSREIADRGNGLDTFHAGVHDNDYMGTVAAHISDNVAMADYQVRSEARRVGTE